MVVRPRTAWRLVQAALAGWWADRAMSMGAAIAFYTTFSLAPMLLLAVAVAGLAFGETAARGAIAREIGGLVGPNGAAALEAMIRSAADTGSGILGTVVGVVTFLFLATGALVELQNSLNIVWKADLSVSRSGWLVSFVRTRLLSLALILAFGFLMLVSLTFDAAIVALGGYVGALLPGVPALLSVLNFLLSLAGTFAILVLIYKLLPAVEIAWRDVWFGAAVTAGLFALGKFVIGAYVGRSGLSSTYGAAASIIAILLWVYYSALIVLFGAELTKAHAEDRSSRIERSAAATDAK